MIKIIEEVLNNYIRPSLALHGGDLKVLSYKDGILKIKLLGKCSICPSATITTEEFINNKVIEHVPEVSKVIVFQEISEELLSFAKKIFTKNID